MFIYYLPYLFSLIYRLHIGNRRVTVYKIANKFSPRKYLDVVEGELDTCKQNLYVNYDKTLAEVSNSECEIYFISAKVCLRPTTTTTTTTTKSTSICIESVTHDTSFYQFIHVYIFRI